MKRLRVYGIYCLIILFLLIIGRIAHGLAGVSVYDTCKALSCGSIPVDYPVVNEEIIWTQEMENKRLEALKPKKIVKVTPKVEKTEKQPKEVKIDTSFDINKLAKAVAIAETGNCTKGYGKTHNNCHGIKSGNTYKCPGTPKGKMCRFKDREESFTAFKVIWQRWYKTLPTHTQAVRWTGADSSANWRRHVLHFYNQ